MNASEIPSGSIVVAVDGSEHAARVVTWAARQAHLERRPLCIVHVNEGGTTPDIVQDAATLAHVTCPDIDVQAVTLAGDPHEVLVALSHDVHSIVMGSHGYGVVRSKMLGSVSAAVAKQAACPVVVSRPTHVRFAKSAVVVGADGSPESLPVIEFAFRQASLRGIPLHVVHCYENARTGWRHRAGGQLDKDSLRLLLSESVAGMAEEYPDVHVTLRLENGTVEELLDRGLRPWELVVIGRHPPPPTHRLADEDTFATAVLERSQSAVAVVPEAPGPDADAPVATPSGRGSESTHTGGVS